MYAAKGGFNMATFFLFGKYTPDAVKQISAERTKKANALIEANGGKVQSGFALMGEFDLVLIVDFPDIKQAMKTSVGLARLLGISFTTAPAVSVEEFDKLIV
jgi:uncharacterized protein with GYD domain